jgi:hypothetical protein
MRFATEHAACSWTIPVPVKRSRFAAMVPSHHVHNVETDLAAIRGFALDASADLPPIAWADLQTLPMWNALRRLGSGRAAVHRGAYLKGIGRTTLAANWSDVEDRYHGSGHMLPSAAAREWLVSRALEALDLVHTICPCNGVLAATLDQPADEWLGSIWPGDLDRFATSDRRLQAISVKPADFARLSNFLWALDHVGAPIELAELFHRMHVYLTPPGLRALSPNASSPPAIVRALVGAIERGLDHFADWTRAGVHWGSLSNNLTADGRFLDLEVPMVLLRPFFGVVTAPDGQWQASNWFGLEVLAWVQETRAFVGALRERVRGLARYAFSRGVFHDFLEQLGQELDEQLPSEHVLWSRPLLEERATAAVVDALALDGHRADAVRAIVDRQAAITFDGARADWSDLSLRCIDLHVAAPEPGQARVCAHPAFLADVYADGFAAGRVFNDGLRAIDASREPAELFDRLATVGREVTSLLAPVTRRAAS